MLQADKWKQVHLVTTKSGEGSKQKQQAKQLQTEKSKTKQEV